MNSVKAIKYNRGKLEVLDQLRLPHEVFYEDISTCEEAFDCIVAMRVRGAPAIAIVAALSLAVELERKIDCATSPEVLINYVNRRLDYLMSSRPTAVDLSSAVKTLKKNLIAMMNISTTSSNTCNELRSAYIETAEKILQDDLSTNLAIGKNGADFLETIISLSSKEREAHKSQCKISVLTHCNTGSLATSGYGTALGIIRSLHEKNHLLHVYFTETRPFNQGSRLTAFEMIKESIPSTLIADSMVGALFAKKKAEQNIKAVIVGADRVARNGDTANKIGTYSVAVLAKYHGIKFIVAAPTTSIDLHTESGASIRIEERRSTEMTQISGPVIGKNGQVNTSQVVCVATAEQNVNVWNPAFDVTPAALIDAIITEKGEIIRGPDDIFDLSKVFSNN